MNRINRANLDARWIFAIDARLCNDTNSHQILQKVLLKSGMAHHTRK
jgi:hypothetical protein